MVSLFGVSLGEGYVGSYVCIVEASGSPVCSTCGQVTFKGFQGKGKGDFILLPLHTYHHTVFHHFNSYCIQCLLDHKEGAAFSSQARII
jgi:hypothetical protein